ncbi:MAG: orotidine-5'-phosphate decarboxylase [Methanoregulaceae archaeon]|nr:orotidine-5'-phosphate decarboxylase [Methanoregulaceae archaeon]
MTRLILALDVTSKVDALRIAGQCAPYIDAIKIGYPLVLSSGLSIAGELRATGLPLIADFKVADIPNTNRLIAGQVFSRGFSGIICHGFTGGDSAEACISSAHEHGGECFIVAEMSHPGAEEFFHGGVAERIAELAIRLGADGIIAPATRPDRVLLLRNIVGEKKIYSPGVGAQGGDPALLAGLVDGIIVGRQIYSSPDPASAAAQFAPLRL